MNRGDVRRGLFDILPVQNSQQLRTDWRDVSFDRASLRERNFGGIFRKRGFRRALMQHRLNVHQLLINMAAGDSQGPLLRFVQLRAVRRSGGHCNALPVRKYSSKSRAKWRDRGNAANPENETRDK